MGLKNAVQPVSYLKNHVAEMIDTVSGDHNEVIITQNGRARAVLIGIDEYEKWQNAVAMMKILALAEADAKTGRWISQDQVFDRAFNVIRKIENGQG